MAEKSIVTQSQLGDLKLALAQEADAIAYHSADSMSGAHGWNITNGTNADRFGNSLENYTDSHGDIIGTKQLVVAYNGTNYYAPAMPTSLAGQAATAGVVADTSALLQPGDNSWVTDYTTGAVDDSKLVLSGLLLPHTRQSYWETHGSIRVFEQDSFDNATPVAHKTGDYIIETFAGSKKIWIPASNKIGGPDKNLVVSNCPNVYWNGTRFYMYADGSVSAGTCTMSWELTGGGGTNMAFLLYINVLGTKPYEAVWQVYLNGAWNSMSLGNNYRNADNSGVSTNGLKGMGGSTGYGYDEPHTYNNKSSILRWSGAGLSPGGNKTSVLYLRVKLRNSAGDSYSGPLTFTIRDST